MPIPTWNARARRSLDRLLQLGVDAQHKPWSNQKNIYLNQLLLVSTASAILFSIVNLCFAQWSLLAMGLLLILFNCTLFYFQYRGLQLLARGITYAGYPLIFFAIGLFGQGQVDNEFAYLLMLLLMIIFIRRRQMQYTFLAYISVLFIIQQLVTHSYSGMPATWVDIANNLVMFFAIAAGIIYITNSFIHQIITTRKKNQHLVGQLSRSNEELKRFNYLVSHDLRSPLRQITLFAKMAKKSTLEADTNATLESLEYIGNTGRELYQLTEDLLKLAHIDRRELPAELQPVAPIFQKIVNQFHAPDAGIFIKTTTNDTYLRCNDTLLQMVLQNLVENGLKYNENYPKEIEIIAEEMAGKLIISVKDNGIGISEEYQDKIFEYFTRLHNNNDYQGNGLGLAIVRKVTELYGGKAWMVPQPKGSVFVLSFPLARRSESLATTFMQTA